jgi:hypothetical protein
MGASSRHITNLKQYILETFDIYGFWLHFVVLLKSDLDVQQTNLRCCIKKLLMTNILDGVPY